MKLNLACEVQKKVSKDNKTYYVLYIEEIGKQVFLSDTEVKLLSILHPSESEE